ncbi:MAG: hypothetical protein K8S62_08785 [Candidatus Sabulitectum sp.]|nr:hypothetical protein [Candidatus Sabulitectum sp.]
MSDIRTKLDELERFLGSSVSDALDAALQVEIPCGESPAWLELLDVFRQEQTAEDSRQRAAASTGQLFGAPPDELNMVLTEIAGSAKERLNKLEWKDDGQNSGRVQRIFNVIDCIPRETLILYRKRVMPQRRSMFAGAMASAQQSVRKPEPANSTSKTFIMRCGKCGAPRLKKDNFTCEYCDTPYAEQ